jgi:hypothetical protein
MAGNGRIPTLTKTSDRVNKKAIASKAFVKNVAEEIATEIRSMPTTE